MASALLALLRLCGTSEGEHLSRCSRQIFRQMTSEVRTLTVNADCTGTMTILNVNMAPLNLQILVAQAGETVHTVVIDPGFAVSSDAERVHTPKK